MKTLFKQNAFKHSLIACATCAGMLFSSHAFADCSVEAPAQRTNINILSNSYPSVNHIAKEMESCSEGRLRVRAKLTTEHQELKRLALGSSGRAPYQIMQLSTSDFAEYIDKDWVAPITEYVNKYKTQYNLDDIPQPLWDAVTVDGEIYVLPLQQNLQHFFYRKDVFDKHNIAVPANYPDVIKAARKIQRADSSIEYPIAQTFGSGWGIATEFTNIYLSLGGQFFDENRNPVFHTDRAGRQTIAIMTDMLKYMSPNALTFSNDDTMVAFQQGKSVMGNVWASRAGNMDDESVSTVVGKVHFAAAPAGKRGAPPSATVWWDGYIIPKNVPPADRELAFLIMAEATDRESMEAGGSLAFYSRESVTTNPEMVAKNRYWPAMLDTVKGGAPAFPAATRSHFNLAHTALGSNLADALSGKTKPKDALEKAAAEYIKEAKAKGFI